jgi:hypothetical protein
MPINETCAVSVTLQFDAPAPVFIPLLTVDAGDIVIPNQSILAVTGTPLPLEVAVMLCKYDTMLGTPADEAVLQVGDVFNVTTDQPTALLGNVPPLAQGGVLGLHVPVALLTTGAKVEGVLSIVR